MQIKIFGTLENTNELLMRVNTSLDELGLNDFIKVEVTQDENLKKELNILKEPALIIEEEAIDFKDTIFEGITPETDELKSMFVSIIGGGDTGGSCSTSDSGCGGCTGC